MSDYQTGDVSKKVVDFYSMLNFIFPDETDEFIQKLELKYNNEDGYYEIYPTYVEAKNAKEIISIQEFETGLIYDEHGKLLAGFTFEDKHFVSQNFIQNKNSKLFGDIEDSISSNFEDYRLKRLVSRYISLINVYGVTKEVKHSYGSTELEHILWMLKSIYPKKSRSLLERYMFLGYIQGVLSSKNLISVRHERDIMKDLF